MQLFAAALEYAPGTRLQGTPCTFVRFRVIVYGDADLWIENDGNASEHLEANDIFVHSIQSCDGINIARINVSKTDLKGFVEWEPGTVSETLTLRTFLNVFDSNGKSMFGQDNCWDTIMIGNQSLTYWYEQIRQQPIRG